ncbi:hypothetical protein B0H13DRAFT_1862970 [Mycena leptocephala]|nr:hypothetical protein B0H13DRAFT_1862970 [Mycena leptocephala]
MLRLKPSYPTPPGKVHVTSPRAPSPPHSTIPRGPWDRNVALTDPLGEVPRAAPAQGLHHRAARRTCAPVVRRRRIRCARAQRCTRVLAHPEPWVPELPATHRENVLSAELGWSQYAVTQGTPSAWNCAHTTRRIVSDASWRVEEGPTRLDDTYDKAGFNDLKCRAAYAWAPPTSCGNRGNARRLSPNFLMKATSTSKSLDGWAQFYNVDRFEPRLLSETIKPHLIGFEGKHFGCLDLHAGVMCGGSSVMLTPAQHKLAQPNSHSAWCTKLLWQGTPPELV